MQKFCSQCPRQCGIDRSSQVGFCGAPAEIRIARAALHLWEEPCLVGEKGSGTIFFCGCNLRCVFCQNHVISHGNQTGQVVSSEELKALMLSLRDAGACNINLVTPTHYAEALIPILREIRPQLGIPVVYNCGGYESVSVLQKLEGLIDIYLPDFKYLDSALSLQASSAPDYFTVAREALREMLRQCPTPHYDSNSRLLQGVILRHLILPSHRKDSIALLQHLAKEFGTDAFLLSLMSQYTPDFAAPDAPASFHRRLTEFEIQSVQKEALCLGFVGYLQDRSAADSGYTPSFDAKELAAWLNRYRKRHT